MTPARYLATWSSRLYASLTGFTSGTGLGIRDGALFALPISKRYVSAPQPSPVAGGQLTFTHGLGGIPEIIILEATCVTADNGYAVGDVVHINVVADTVGNTNAYGAGILKSATTIVLMWATAGWSSMLHRTTRSSVTLTPANWTVTLKAYL